MSKLRTTLRKDTASLALPEGRRVGQPGHEKAKAFLLRRMGETAAEPFRGDTFELPFEVDSMAFTNLVGRIPGNDPSIPPILVGAHYDSIIDAPCADDNATAVAIVLSIAESFQPAQLKRDLVIALFDSEEPPYFQTPAMGSTRFYEDYCTDIDFACAVVLDLVGHDVVIPHPAARLLPGLKKLIFVLGAESAPALPAVVEAAADRARGLRVMPTLNRYIGDMSDHHAFRLGGEPFLFLSCGQGKNYHKATDDLRWINFGKVERVFALVVSLIRGIDSSQIKPQSHDPFEFEIRMIRKAFGMALPSLLRASDLGPLKSRQDIDSFAQAMTRVVAGQ